MQRDLRSSLSEYLSALHTFVPRRWVGVVLFKLNWLLLVAGQERWLLLVVGFTLPLQLLAVLSLNAIHAQGHRVMLCCLLFACVGMIADQALSFSGILLFPTQWLPAWLMLLWLAFALLLPHITDLLLRLPMFAWSLLGAAGGVVSYRAGAALDAVTLLQPLWLSSTVLAMTWALMLPLWRALIVRQLRGPALAQVAACMGAIILTLGVASAPADARASDLAFVGRGHFRFLALPIYDATLRAAQLPFQFPGTVPFELSLEYKRDFSSAHIINETSRQWHKQNVAVREEWLQWLRQAIPDVESGDTLTLRVDAQNTSQLFHNEQLMSTITNPDFTFAFASIWLGTNTSEPRLRRQLLGEPR